MSTATINRVDAPRFHCGYDGETEYYWRGKLWAVRTHAANTQPEPDNRLVGCVFGDSTDNRHEFPPAELMEFFPGYAAAAYVPTGETYQISTTCGPLTCDRCEWQFSEEPRQEFDKYGRLRAVAWRENMERHGVSI